MPFGITVFETVALDHSATSPNEHTTHGTIKTENFGFKFMV